MNEEQLIQNQSFDLSHQSEKHYLKTASEIELLLCCARTNLEPEIKERIEFLLEQDIDWDYLMQIATNHGVIPLLYQSLKNTDPQKIPKQTFHKLRCHFQANELRNYYLIEKLIEILNKLKAEGIAAVSFKGPLLAITAYNGLSLRQFSDLDILVKTDDFVRATSILLQSKFKPINELESPDYRAEELYLQEIDEFTLINNQESIDIICDLHQSITVSHFRKGKIEFSTIQDKLSEIAINQNQLNTIKPDYLLILLCIHASRHFWEQLNWICDLNELINSSPKINWIETLNEATSIGCRYHFLLGLSLSHYYLGTNIPQDIHIVIQKSLRIKYLSRYIKKTIFSVSEDFLDQGFNLNNFIYQMLLTNSLQGYRETIEYFIFPSTKDKLIFNLPRKLSFLYYFLRPVRLLSELVTRK